MKPFILLGEPGTKRTEYLQKAARDLGVELSVGRMGEFDPASAPPAFIKIDPYSYDSGSVERLEEFTKIYSNILKNLSDGRHCFLNEPEAILAVLDKAACKQRLEQLQIPVTQTVGGRLQNIGQLQELCFEKRLPGVFVKPRFGSGAAGVLAYRFQHQRNRQVLYTSSRLCKDDLVNTRTLRRTEDPKEIGEIVNRILRLDTIVERWYPKAKTGAGSYDLRVVVQFGQTDYQIARTSAGPITNLQLNNGAVPFEALRLPNQVTEEITYVCRRVMEAYPGLKSAGIDLLLEEGSLKPYVIEVNGQGDLIYQDIFSENRIYKNQITYYQDNFKGK